MTGGQFQINSASTSGTLTITNTTGAGNLLISGNNGSRVFHVLANGNLTLNGVTVTNGNSGSFGGGILNDNGTLIITNSIISGNMTIGAGAGIYNQSGTVTLTNSTVSGNTSTGSFGGGIVNEIGTMTLTNSTVSENTAPVGNAGGGIFNRGTLTVTNSTISGNTSLGVGGIRNDSTLTLTNVTVTNNRSTSTEACTPCAGGIANASGVVSIDNTIVAGNTASLATIAPDFSGAVSSPSSNNIIGNNLGTTGITDGVNGNQVGTPTNPIDPRLGGLANNGGATKTHALLIGSSAIDAGNNCVYLGNCPSNNPPFALLSDQRGDGFTRSADANGDNIQVVDIGAFEIQLVPTAATVSVSGRVMTAGGGSITNARLTLTDSQGNVRTTTTDSSGYYHFDDVQAGQTYILSATGKRYSFSQPLQVLNIKEEANQVNFIAISEKRLRVF
jgi:hypothetical protein